MSLRMRKYYTGIGARKTPTHELNMMQSVATILAGEEYVLRSGGADGADQAFERGCDEAGGEKEIYIPWKNFCNNPSPFHNLPPEAFKLAEQYHPKWNQLAVSIKKIMARNVMQVLGQDLSTPSSLLLCWTPDGCESIMTRTTETGGTGMAIAIASVHNVPVINMKNVDWIQRFAKFIGNEG